MMATSNQEERLPSYGQFFDRLGRVVQALVGSFARLTVTDEHYEDLLALFPRLGVVTLAEVKGGLAGSKRKRMLTPATGRAAVKRARTVRVPVVSAEAIEDQPASASIVPVWRIKGSVSTPVPKIKIPSSVPVQYEKLVRTKEASWGRKTVVMNVELHQLLTSVFGLRRRLRSMLDLSEPSLLYMQAEQVDRSTKRWIWCQTLMCDNIDVRYYFGGGKRSFKVLVDNPGPITIFVKTLTGETITIDTHTNHTVRTVMHLVFVKTHVPVVQQRLIFAGRQLEIDRPLASYRVQKESTFHLVLRLRGGMYHETSGPNGTGTLSVCGQERVDAVKRLMKVDAVGLALGGDPGPAIAALQVIKQDSWAISGQQLRKTVTGKNYYTGVACTPAIDAFF